MPVLEKLGVATGLNFELMIVPTIPAFETTLYKGVPDFAFVNPYHCIVAKRQQAYIPLLRDSAALLKGIVVVRSDNPIVSVAELDGKKLAFPAPNAFAASLLIQALLAEKHINIIPGFVKTHSNVYRSVVMADVDAGGGVNNTFDREPADIHDQLRILYETPGFAPHPLMANPRISEALRAKVTASFIALAADPANAALFDAIQMPKPVAADYGRDYLALEKLGLEKFTVYEGE
jgi:phosphonate transport system substrate-binding protein